MPSRKPRRDRLPPQLAQVHLNAAGIDVGSEFHFMAVPPDRDEFPVRKFPAFTAEARIVYFTLKYGWTYVDKGAQWYEQQFRQRILKSLQSRALQLGYTLTPVPKAR